MHVVRWLPILVLASCAERPNAAGPNVIEVPRAGKAPFVDAAPSTEDEARRLMLEGRELAKQKAYPEAIAKFEASMKKVPNVELYYDLGSAYEALGQNHKAAEIYEIYVAKGELSHMDRMSMELRIKQLRRVE